ncbi:MAG: DsbA family protein [Rhodospirillaceae bacterium]|nr:DsbA family protein [Rhodospirillaceae bacterium]
MNARNIVIGIVILALVGVGGFYAWTQYGPGAGSQSAVLDGLPEPIVDPLAQVQEGDMVLGDPDAPITFIEYSSLSCPHCARFHSAVLPEIKKAYIDTGKVKLVLRDFALNRPAFEAALLAHCVSPMAYWGMIDQLFSTQRGWVNENSTAALSMMAAAAGINGKDFQGCLADEAVKQRILNSAEQGSTVFKINSTPTFVVNGIVVTGERSFADFEQIFDALAAQ